MPKSGEVYWGRIEYKDFGSSLKLFLVLHVDIPSDRIIVCIVTKVAKEKDKHRAFGCNVATQRFLVEASREFFELNTYIELLRFKEWRLKEFIACVPKVYECKFILPPKLLNDIKDCLKRLVDDIAPDFQGVLL